VLESGREAPAGRGRRTDIASRLRDGAVPIAAIFGLLSLLLFVRIPRQGAWLDASLDASHAPIFAAVAVLLAVLLRPASWPEPSSWPDRRRFGRAFVLSVAIGVLIELLQSLSNRPPSLFDVCTDAAGAAIGLALLALVERSRLPEPRPPAGSFGRLLAALAVTGALFVSWHPVRTAHAYVARAQDFPRLMEFEDTVALPLVSTQHATVTVGSVSPRWRRGPGDHALRVRYEVGSSESGPPIRYVAIEPHPDWRGYSALVLDLVNPGPSELPLTLRILDARHDWGQDPPPSLPVVVQAGTRADYRIDLRSIAAVSGRRQPDLARIEELFVFPTQADAPGEIEIAGVWLEK
jgi:hypothetical protein